MKWQIEFESDGDYRECPALRHRSRNKCFCKLSEYRDCPGLGDPGCPAKPVEEGKCRWTWKWDEEDGCNWWFTDCGHKRDDINKYCPHCGRELVEGK